MAGGSTAVTDAIWSGPAAHPVAPIRAAATAVRAIIAPILVKKGFGPDLGFSIDPAGHQLQFKLGDHGAVTDQVERRRGEGREPVEHRGGDPAMTSRPVRSRGGQIE